MIVPNRIMQAERLVTPAPTVAGPFVLFDDDGRHIELAQPCSERDAALTATDNDAIGLTRGAKLSLFRLALFFPCLSVGFGAMFRPHGTVEAKRFFVALEFAHG